MILNIHVINYVFNFILNKNKKNRIQNLQFIILILKINFQIKEFQFFSLLFLLISIIKSILISVNLIYS